MLPVFNITIIVFAIFVILFNNPKPKLKQNGIESF